MIIKSHAAPDDIRFIHFIYWRITVKSFMKLILAVATAAASGAVALPATALTVDSSGSNNALLNAILGNTAGLSNFNVTSTGNPSAFGLFSNDTVFGLGSGIVLSTGNVNNVVGPNDSNSSGTIFGTPGDPSIANSRDLASLDITFDADATVEQLFFQYVFGSEEFLEFAGSAFNDTFQLLLNGTNLALLPNGNSVTVNNLAASPTGPFNPAFKPNTGNETQLDGYTQVLTFAGLLNKSAQNVLTIKIADLGDGEYDSAAFIKGGTVGVEPPSTDVPTPALLPGLIGLGVAALRKRKGAAAETEAV
jgi:hypothetical protein